MLVARIEPPQGVDSLQQAQFSRLATILQLSSEYQGTRAEVRSARPERTIAPSLRARPRSRIPRFRTTVTPSFLARVRSTRARAIPSPARTRQSLQVHA